MLLLRVCATLVSTVWSASLLCFEEDEVDASRPLAKGT